MELLNKEELSPDIHSFPGDGLIPNNELPLILYRGIPKPDTVGFLEFMERTFQANGWTNNWRDIILSQHHYHTTTHEVLGIVRGEVKVRLGGRNGKDFLVKQGDVIIIPAGVGHCALKGCQDYLVVGGYPKGLEWDLVFEEPDKYEEAKKRIKGLDLPLKDPVLGHNGHLLDLWTH